MPDETSNIDDDFFADLQGDTNSDFADPFTTEGSESVSADPFASIEGFSDGAAASATEEAFGAEPTTAEAAEEPVAAGKKGKKAKKEKAPKAAKTKASKYEKVPKEPKAKKEKPVKVKKEKAPKHAYYGSPAPVFTLLAVLTAALGAANAAAVSIAGSASSTFLIVLDVFGLLLLAIPTLLLKHLRQRPIGLFDFFLALAAILCVVSTMIIITEQAKEYGASAKVSSAVVQIELPETLDC